MLVDIFITITIMIHIWDVKLVLHKHLVPRVRPCILGADQNLRVMGMVYKPLTAQGLATTADCRVVEHTATFCFL